MFPKKLLKNYSSILVILLIFLVNSCAKSDFYEHKALVYGTVLEFKFYKTDAELSDKAIKQVINRLNTINKQFHPWKESEISEFNKNHQLKYTDDSFIKILSKAKYYENFTHSLFNPSIGKLINLWGFHADTIIGNIPSENKVNIILNSKPSLNQLLITKNTITTKNKELEIDLGGMIKGLSLDIANEIYEELGIDNVLTNFGGNILARGKPNNRYWEIAIQNPLDNKLLLAKLKLEPGMAIGTSGDYEKYFLKNGSRFSHLINPINGYPIKKYSSATVLITPQEDAGIKSDVLSKPVIFSNDLNKTRDDLNLDYFFVTTREKKIFISESFLNKVEWLFEKDEFDVQTF